MAASNLPPAVLYIHTGGTTIDVAVVCSNQTALRLAISILACTSGTNMARGPGMAGVCFVEACVGRLVAAGEDDSARG